MPKIKPPPGQQAEIEPEAKWNRDLEKIVEKLKALDKRDVSSAIEKGRLLEQVQNQCEHGEYMDIIEQKLGWSYTTAIRYLRVYRFSQNHQIGEFANLSISVLYLVADLDDDDDEEKAAINAIVEAANKGRVTHKMADAIINEHKSSDCHVCDKEFKLNKLRYDIDRKGGLICEDCLASREADRKEAEAEALALEAEAEAGTLPPSDAPAPASPVPRPQDQEAVPPDRRTNGATPAPITSAELNALTDAKREQRLTDQATFNDALKLQRALYHLLQFKADDQVWPNAIEHNIGYDRLLKIIATLQAVYDKHSQGNSVTAKADRAESKTAHKPH